MLTEPIEPTTQGARAIRLAVRVLLAAKDMRQTELASLENPQMTRVRVRLSDWQHTLEQLRDRATTLAMRKGPSGQDPRRRKGKNGWNPADPRG